MTDLGSDGTVEVARALSDSGSDLIKLCLGFNGAGNLTMEELLGEHTKKLANLKNWNLLEVQLLQDYFRERFREDGAAVEVACRPPDADVDSDDDSDDDLEVNADGDSDDDSEGEDDFDRNAGAVHEDVYPNEDEEEDTGFESTLLCYLSEYEITHLMGSICSKFEFCNGAVSTHA